MIGISPAFFISRFTDRFSVTRAAEGLAEISKLGFTAFQPEVFHSEHLNDWQNGGDIEIVCTPDKIAEEYRHERNTIIKRPVGHRPATVRHKGERPC